MPDLSMPAGPAAGWWYLAAFVAVIAVAWWLGNLIYPNRPCRWCKGGRWRAPWDRKAWRDCWFCGGTGRRRHFVSRGRQDARRGGRRRPRRGGRRG